MELNELLSESRKKRLKRRRTFFLIFIIVLAVAAAAGIVWAVFYSPWLRVEDIVVRGNASVPTADVMAMAQADYAAIHHTFLSPGPKNMLAWPTAIASGVLAAEPQLATAVMSKDYADHEIVVTVAERQPLAVWCVMGTVAGTESPSESPGLSESGSVPAATTTAIVAPVSADESCYWFDETGTLFARTFDTEGNLLFAVHDYSYSQSNLTLGSPALPARFMPNLLSILGVLRASGLRVKEIRLNDISLEEIQVATYNGPDVYFSLRFPADDTLTALKSIMAKPGFAKLQYVDFRTQDRVYYE